MPTFPLGYFWHLSIFAERYHQLAMYRDDVLEKQMFGAYCWMLDGNMLCSVAVGRCMFRVGKDREALDLQRCGASTTNITCKRTPGFIWLDAARARGQRWNQWRGSRGACAAAPDHPPGTVIRLRSRGTTKSTKLRTLPDSNRACG